MSADQRETGPAELVCIGIATLDVIARVERLPASGERHEAREIRLAGGGVAATAAVAAARLGISVAFIGRVADDPAGRIVRDGLAGEGIDVSRLRTVGGRTPVTVVSVEPGGERTLVPDVGGVPPIELALDDVAAAAAARWVHVDQTGHPAVAALRSAGVRTAVSFDGGNTSRHLSLAGIDLYAPTATALLARHPGPLDAALEAALAEGPRLVVVTRGAEGCTVAAREPAGASVQHVPAAAGAEVVSTLGAGDVFHGALLASLIAGHPLRASLERANAAALLACRALDGQSAIPSNAELDAFMRSAEVASGPS
jgi:sulfofructose kinase